jgi:hypothetical protein
MPLLDEVIPGLDILTFPILNFKTFFIVTDPDG